MNKQTSNSHFLPPYTLSTSIFHHSQLHCQKIGLFCLWGDFGHFRQVAPWEANGRKVLRFMGKSETRDTSEAILEVRHSFCDVGGGLILNKQPIKQFSKYVMSQQHFLKVFGMKGKKQKKRSEEKQAEVDRCKLQHAFPLKISFNLCKDNIACFVGEKKNNKKKTQKPTAASQKSKHSLPKGQTQPEKDRIKIELPKRTVKTQCEQIIQGSLNSIVGQIEEKGIGCRWGEMEEQNAASNEEVFDKESQELWSAFSLNSSFSKSHASTVDVHPSHPSLAYYGRYSSQAYYYDYSYKPYEEGSLYQVFPEYIHNDARTTVMIRNIPNKYTIKELADEIDLHFDNTYDFLYLPCDIKNQCNVGYGFINFLTTDYLKAFYEHFQGKKWARFRSEKICNLTYARLQGLNNLIQHFENSKVQKDKKYRPIIREFGQISHLIKSQQLL